MDKILCIPKREHMKNNVYYVPGDVIEIGKATFVESEEFYL